MNPENDPTLNRLIEWGQARPDVRAMLLTSTRTVPGADLDRLSDYDVIIAVSDDPGILPFFASRDWLEAFGRVLVLYRDPISSWFNRHQPPSPDGSEEDGAFAYITQYEEDGLKIDFTLITASLLRRIAQSPLGEDLDLGYRILLDKDGLTAGMAAPTHRAYIPRPPSQARYLEVIELFFHECTYAAKYLWRDDLLPAKGLLVETLIGGHLRCMLEWQAEIDAGWSLRLKAHGRGLKKIVAPELWAELESLYVGPGLQDNWDALWRTIEMFTRLARQVGAALGYTYPEDMHRRSLAYFKWVQELP
ncbi:MAG: aminoglycoside 6-adenylyltransferase [Chloroflexota bacterium]